MASKSVWETGTLCFCGTGVVSSWMLERQLPSDEGNYHFLQGMLALKDVKVGFEIGKNFDKSHRHDIHHKMLLPF